MPGIYVNKLCRKELVCNYKSDTKPSLCLIRLDCLSHVIKMKSWQICLHFGLCYRWLGHQEPEKLMLQCR